MGVWSAYEWDIFWVAVKWNGCHCPCMHWRIVLRTRRIAAIVCRKWHHRNCTQKVILLFCTQIPVGYAVCLFVLLSVARSNVTFLLSIMRSLRLSQIDLRKSKLLLMRFMTAYFLWLSSGDLMPKNGKWFVLAKHRRHLLLFSNNQIKIFYQFGSAIFSCIGTDINIASWNDNGTI